MWIFRWEYWLNNKQAESFIGGFGIDSLQWKQQKKKRADVSFLAAHKAATLHLIFHCSWKLIRSRITPMRLTNGFFVWQSAKVREKERDELLQTVIFVTVS